MEDKNKRREQIIIATKTAKECTDNMQTTG